VQGLRHRLRVFRDLHGVTELLLLLRLGAFAATVPCLMRLPLTRLSTLLTRPAGSRHPTASEIERLDRLVSLAPRLAHPLVRSGCLTRGVTLFWFLRRAGLDVELAFGLDAGQDRAVDGHCWLTLGGEPFLEKRDPRSQFAELYRLPLRA
jgi:hypothetical protein